jgi:hypothetical protein
MRQVAVFLLVGLSGCGSGSQSCTPGTQQACACPGGASGVQVCLLSGSGFGPCTGGGCGAVGLDMAQGSSPDMAQGASDKQVCDSACAALIGCGVLYDNTCSSNCQNSAPVFLACARAAGSDCNALALCTSKQFSASFCGGGSAGVPQGAGTCNSLRSCNATCIGTPNPLPCYCACNAALAPSLAINALIDDQCSTAYCKVECATSVMACGACQMQHCVAQSAQCANH